MSSERSARKGGKKRHRRPGTAEAGQPPPKASSPAAWTSKTLHHPAFRIGEIKHGRS